MSRFLDYFITSLIVGLAVWYLYRTLVKKRGCSCGSSSCKGTPPADSQNNNSST